MASNPSAFPRPASEAHSHGMHSAQEGMTLRDYFASKAMQPLMAHSGGYWDDDNLYGYAFMAYKMADAMLKARDENSR